MMKPNRNITTLLMANALILNSRRFTMGWSWTSSHTTNATSDTAETTVKPRMIGNENPSSRSNRSSTICRQPKPRMTSVKPR